MSEIVPPPPPLDETIQGSGFWWHCEDNGWRRLTFHQEHRISSLNFRWARADDGWVHLQAKVNHNPNSYGMACGNKTEPDRCVTSALSTHVCVTCKGVAARLHFE